MLRNTWNQKVRTTKKFTRIKLNFLLHTIMGFLGGSDSKASACNAGALGSMPGWERFPGEGNGNPLQYSCLENPMDGGAWCRLLFMGSQRVRHNWDFPFLSFPCGGSVVENLPATQETQEMWGEWGTHLLGKCHGQRSLQATVPGAAESDTPGVTEDMCIHTETTGTIPCLTVQREQDKAALCLISSIVFMFYLP